MLGLLQRLLGQSRKRGLFVQRVDRDRFDRVDERSCGNGSRGTDDAEDVGQERWRNVRIHIEVHEEGAVLLLQTLQSCQHALEQDVLVAVCSRDDELRMRIREDRFPPHFRLGLRQRFHHEALREDKARRLRDAHLTHAQHAHIWRFCAHRIGLRDSCVAHPTGFSRAVKRTMGTLE